MQALTQKKLQQLLHPIMMQSGKNYKKYQPIYARLAEKNERIITLINGQKETSNTAKRGDYIVKNLTTSQEEYIVSAHKFAKLYVFSEKINTQWSQYLPQGTIKAVAVNQQLLNYLKQTEPFYINAPWGTLQRVEKGDYLVMPLPQQDEIYRIARSAFNATYRPIISK